MDKKISELAELLEASTTDVIAVVSDGETKQITADNWRNSPIPTRAVLFDITAEEPASTEGLVFYDAINKTISLRTELPDVTLQVGQELQIRVKNDSGVDINNGQPVYISGINGGLPTVVLAKADAAATSVVAGIVTSDLLDGNEGRITVFGLVRDIDTSAFAPKDVVYLSADVAGDLVAEAPVSPNTVSVLGTVVVSDATEGSLLVNTIVNSVVLDQRYTTTGIQLWSFGSPSGTAGTFYTGGYYAFGGSSNDFSPSITFGTANASYAAHLMLVLGEAAVDDITIRITGTSINDQGVRAAGATQDIVIPSGSSPNAFFETSKKWLGQVTIEAISGTPKLCNYGWCKYWDNNNSNYKLVGVEAVWEAGASDASPNISIIHHKATGWTYGAGGTPTPPYVVRMNTDHIVEIQTVNGESGAWKRDNLSTTVLGGDSEGLVVEIFTSANKAFDVNSNINITISPA